MIQVRNLTKSYGDVTPLSDISVDIHAGEVISIIGPSGTGKSTLLRCLNLLETPTAGQIIVDGTDITAPVCPLNQVRQKMGMVFQSFNLYNHLNVIENIMLAPMKLLGLSRQDAYARGMRLLRAVSLDQKELAYPDELSGGQKQRIAIARTLAMEPEIILFDEPTSALDPTMVREVLTVIKGLADKGMTMIIVTHEMKFARDISTRIFYMDQGKIYEDGTPEQIFDHPQRELTRRFVNQIRVYEKDITSARFDYIGMQSEIEEFGRKQLLSQRTIYRINVVLEELCLQTLLTGLEDAGREHTLDDRSPVPVGQSGTRDGLENDATAGIIGFRLEYSEKQKRVDITISSQQVLAGLVEGMNPISAKLVRNAVDSMEVEGTEIAIGIDAEK